jgi:glycosyltransferase involved in cell wall biosynthesis
MMRIALLATPWYRVPPRGYGGIEQVVALLADGLVARGHHVTLVGVSGTGGRAQRVVSTYAEPQGARIGSALPEVLHAARSWRALLDLDLDLVHDHSTAGPLLAPGRSCPTVVTAHNDVTGEHGDVLRELAPHLSVVAISRHQRRLSPDLPWVGTVHNGVDVRRYAFSADKGDHVLFLGRASAAKAPHLAIDAARAAGRRIILAAKCVEEVERRYFDAHIAPRLGPDVDWLGEVDSATKRSLLAGAAALVFPITWDEPFGLVMIEAMASGTPVVALRRGSVDEVVEHGVTGWVCDSADELAARLRDLDDLDPGACRRRVKEHFSADAMVERYERVYERVLAARRPSVVELPDPPVGRPRATRPALLGSGERRIAIGSPADRAGLRGQVTRPAS